MEQDEMIDVSDVSNQEVLPKDNVKLDIDNVLFKPCYSDSINNELFGEPLEVSYAVAKHFRIVEDFATKFGTDGSRTFVVPLNESFDIPRVVLEKIVSFVVIDNGDMSTEDRDSAIVAFLQSMSDAAFFAVVNGSSVLEYERLLAVQADHLAKIIIDTHEKDLYERFNVAVPSNEELQKILQENLFIVQKCRTEMDAVSK